MTSLDDILNPPQEKKLKNAFFISCALHSLFLFFLGASFFAHRQDIVQPKPILIHSVKLSPRPMKQTPARPKLEPQHPQIEKELPAPIEKETPIPEVVIKKEKPPEEKIETESKPEAKKVVVVTKEIVKSSSKPLAKKIVTSKKAPPPTPTKKTENSQENKRKQEIANNVQSLLAQARKQRNTKGTAKGPSKSICGHVSDLSFESEDPHGDEIAYGEMSPEEAYISSLVRLIQLSITIPDKEPVSLKLTLLKSGNLKSVTILSSASSKNRTSVEKGLSSLRFPSFNTAYLDEKEHSFTLRLNREMEWTLGP